MSQFSVNLSKGQKVDLTKGTTLKAVMVELGWSAQVFDGVKHDLDVTAFMLDSSFKTTQNPYGQVKQGPNDWVKLSHGGMAPKNMIFYSNLEHESGAVRHTGDERTGSAGGIGEADETVYVNFDKMPADVDSILFCVTIHNEDENGKPLPVQLTFGQVNDAFIRVVDADNTNNKLVNFDLGEDFSTQTAVVAGRLYKHNGDWKFEAIGQGFNDGLAGLCRLVGLSA